MPKQPQDHKSKKAERDGVFRFEHGGETYEFKDVFDVLTPGFIRKNRRRDDVDAFFTLVEALADDETLDVIDNLPRDEFAKLQRDFNAFLEATPGE